MAYVPGFDIDVFISYARRSDLKDWVTKFKEEMVSQLGSTLSGRPPNVWMDSRLQTGDVFKAEIERLLSRTAIFLAVVSPGYVASEWCMVHEFRYFLDQSGGEPIQILKTPLEPDQCMPRPGDHYLKFFRREDWGDDEFEPGEKDFSKHLKQVASQIRYRLIDLRRHRQQVYVTGLDARTASETLCRYREELINEFEGAGYAILPRQVILDADGDDVRRALEQSDVLIYLMNGGLEERQYVIARELGKSTIICTAQVQAIPNGHTELPILLGTPDWKREALKRVEARLTERQTGVGP